MKSIVIAVLALVMPVAALAQGESVSIKGPNGMISAEYHKPASLAEGQKCPVVILCHCLG